MKSLLKNIAADPMDERPLKPSPNKDLEDAPDQADGGSKIIQWVKSFLPPKEEDADGTDDSLLEAIEELIEEEDTPPQSAVAAHERRLISNILQLRDLPVVDIMVPRVDIVAIDIDTTREELIQLLTEKPHSRIPIYRGDMDNIVGVVHMKDLVAKMATGLTFELKEIMRQAMVVSPAMRVMDLLLQMRQSKVHIAFVIDEFGGIDGLITISDLIEAIVGEIDDEFDFDMDPQMIERADGTAIADARYPLEKFEEKYGDIFSENEENEEVDTIGGLVSYIAGRVPSRGEVIIHEPSKVEFEVMDADPRRVTRLRIRNLPKKEA